MHKEIGIFVQGSIEIRRTIIHLKTIGQKNKAGGEYYRLDRSDGSRYLEPFPKWQREITKYLAELRAKGEVPVYVDICGRAHGRVLGAVKNYSFSLQPIENHFFQSDDETLIEGNLFASRDFNSFIRLLRENDSCPAFVTFEPVAGLQSYTPGTAQGISPTVTYQCLGNKLRRIYDVLLPGGFIYLRRPFQFDGIGEFFAGVPQEKSTLALQIKEFCQNRRCSLQVERSAFGPGWLIRKHLERKRKMV